jgi:predicted ArsR family transcriptional regulator
VDSDLSVLAVLGDPVRRRLYDFVTAQDHEVSRGEAAAATGIQRPLAAFHLDRLAEAGLVDVTFRRTTGRSGPGAGRPAKLYRRTAGEHQVSVPPRDYRGAAELLAGVVDVLGGERELQRAARSRGAAAGRAALRNESARAGTGGEDGGPDHVSPAPQDATMRKPAGASSDNWLTGVLCEQGYQPYPHGPEMRLRNCPFHALASQYPPLICGMNLAMLEGLLEGAAVTGVSARLDPRPDECCVVMTPSKNNDC